MYTEFWWGKLEERDDFKKRRFESENNEPIIGWD